MTAASPRRRLLRRLAALAFVVGAYPAFVLGSVYSHWSTSGLPGGRDGPADAYRHTLASATVAYTGSPRWIDWITAVMEERSPGASHAMDAHNNRIGARIGATAPSWDAMQAAVLDAVRRGQAGATSPEQVTWLAPDRWTERAY